jgi:hypothetical protein
VLDGLLDRIRSRGYWRINLQPKSLLAEKLSLAKCRQLVESSVVRLRGWDYPHISTRNDDESGSQPAGEFYESWINWWNHIEFWRMYRSHQFLHYLALREDWFEESDWSNELAQKFKPGQVLGTGGTIFQITEIFEFAARLGRAEAYPTGVIIDVTLENTANRTLWVDDPNRMPFLHPKMTGAEKLSASSDLSPDEFLNGGSEKALKMIFEIFDNFGWENISQQNIRQQQERFLQGRA